MICTTLNKIRGLNPCEEGWTKLLKYLKKTKDDDEALPFSVIVESNGIDDALWCCRTVDGYDKEWRLFAVWCARRVQHLMSDERSLVALDVAERFANGAATKEELAEADDGAWAAVGDAAAEAAAEAAASTAAWATAASTAASTAAEAAAWTAAAEAAAAEAVTKGLAWTKDLRNARAVQKEQFLKIVG